MNIYADLHVHTVASVHAYSTVLEIANYASSINLGAVAITDHGPDVIDGPHYWHFWNMDIIPRELFGVKILRGVEANILSKDGDIDKSMPEFVYQTLDWVIASIHRDAWKGDMNNTFEEVTSAYLGVLDNPYVDCLGHSGTDKFAYDYEKVIKKAAEKGKVIEINNNSFMIRKGSAENCRTIANLCKKHGVMIALNSDSHFAYTVGKIDTAAKMLEEIEFPKELIVNASEENFNRYLQSRKRGDAPEIQRI